MEMQLYEKVVPASSLRVWSWVHTLVACVTCLRLPPCQDSSGFRLEALKAAAVHPVQIAQWKKQAVAALPQIFASRRDTETEDHEALKAALYQEIGQLKVELDWLKKKHHLVDH